MTPTGAALFIVFTHSPFSGVRLEVYAYQVSEAVAGYGMPVTAEAWEAAGADDVARARRLGRAALDSTADGPQRVRRALMGDERGITGGGLLLDDICAVCGVVKGEED